MTPGQRDATGGRNQLGRASRIVAAMAESGAADLGVREIAALTAMAPSTVHRLLRDLCDLGLVSVEAGARYGIGVEAHRLAGLVTAETWPVATARARLVRLHRSSGGIVVVTHYDPRRRQVTHARPVGGTVPAQLLMPAHRWLPARTGAAALAILAFRPEAETEEAVSSSGPSAGELRERLARIHGCGYAADDAAEVSVVAVPVPEPEGPPRSGIAVLRAPRPVDAAGPADLVPALQETAIAVARDLAGRGGLFRIT